MRIALILFFLLILPGCTDREGALAEFERRHGIEFHYSTLFAGISEFWLADVDRNGLDDVLHFQERDRLPDGSTWCLDQLVVCYSFPGGRWVTVRTNVHSLRDPSSSAPAVQRDIKTSRTDEFTILAILDQGGLRHFQAGRDIMNPFISLEPPPPVEVQAGR
ncbi:MAG: hypothetical protein HY520_01480 [Candidatus Aenigmarchaeota archaeon]|nr:hypothetical protein [Candidatus Aenigmarchaeota archaeon]